MNTEHIKKIAGAVNVVAQLPDGDELVYILGSGDEESNFDALMSWVGDQVDILAIDDPRYRIERLISRLMDRFDSLYAAISSQQ